MADHAVKFTVPYRDLGRSDVEFKVYARQPRSRQKRRSRHLIGTLYISHGAIEWRSRKKHKQGMVKLRWDDFDRYMLRRKDGR